MAWTSLCDLDELTPDAGKYVEIDGHRLAVFLHNALPYVIDNACPHAGGSMAAGFVDPDGCAVCPWHGWAFSLATGSLKGAMSQHAPVISTYPVRLHVREGKSPLVQADLPTP